MQLQRPYEGVRCGCVLLLWAPGVGGDVELGMGGGMGLLAREGVKSNVK